MKRKIQKAKFALAKTGALLMLTCFSFCAWAQNSNASSAITTATNEVKKVYSVGVNLMLAVGAICGLVGAISVFQKWQQGDPQTTKHAAGWFGACIFLVLVGTILKTMFGL